MAKLSIEERRRLLDIHGIGILLDKLDALETVSEKLQLIYEWVKTGHLNLKQFKILVCDVIIEDVKTEADCITKSGNED